MKKQQNPLCPQNTFSKFHTINFLFILPLICTMLFSSILHAQCPMPAPPVYAITGITTDAEDYCPGDDITLTATVDAGVGGTDWFIDWEVNFMGMGWIPAGTAPTCPYMLANDVLVYTPPANMTCAAQQIEFRAYVYHKVEQTSIIADQIYVGDDDPLVDTDGVCAGSANNTCSVIALMPVNPTGLARLCDLNYGGDGTTEGFQPSMARQLHYGLILADGTCTNTDGDGIFDPGAMRPWDFGPFNEDLGCTMIASGDMYQVCIIDDNLDIGGQANGEDGLINDLCIQAFYWDAPAAPVASAMLDIFPDPTAFTVSETPGACGVAASVVITAENGDLCFEMTGNAPTECGDSEPLTYQFDPAFAAACNIVFSGTIEAACDSNGSSGGTANAGSLNGQ